VRRARQAGTLQRITGHLPWEDPALLSPALLHPFFLLPLRLLCGAAPPVRSLPAARLALGTPPACWAEAGREQPGGVGPHASQRAAEAGFPLEGMRRTKEKQSTRRKGWGERCGSRQWLCKLLRA